MVFVEYGPAVGHGEIGDDGNAGAQFSAARRADLTDGVSKNAEVPDEFSLGEPTVISFDNTEKSPHSTTRLSRKNPNTVGIFTRLTSPPARIWLLRLAEMAAAGA